VSLPSGDRAASASERRRDPGTVGRAVTEVESGLLLGAGVSTTVDARAPPCSTTGACEDDSVSESERPSRYQRSANGLLGAMVILVVAVLAFVGFRALLTDEPEVAPEAVDHLEVVALAQDADLHPVYPATLPDGWIATRAEVIPDEPPAFELALLTDDELFVGVVWSGESLDDLLVERVDDEDVEDADPLSVRGSVARQWEGYADPGGDLAYAAEVRERTVLVYGSASAEDLRVVVESLTTAPLTR
jgi:hypothetical protein